MNDASHFLESIDGLACDLDGVVYRGDVPIDGAIRALRVLHEMGKRVVFCTNNSTHTQDAYVQKLAGMGLQVDRDDVITSASVLGEVLEHRGFGGKRALVVGGDGVRRALQDAGVLLADDDGEVDAVVVGRDVNFDFIALHRASTAVRAGAEFLATNDDATYPATDGLEPGAGPLVAAIAVASGRGAEVVGKPHPPMMEAVARRFPPNARLAMAGDRPETDLDGARARGWKSILVLSGVTDESSAWMLDPRPDLVLEDLGGLLGG